MSGDVSEVVAAAVSEHGRRTDTGGCWVPNEVWSGIILSHWGRRDAEHVSNTAYGSDNYSAPHIDDWQKQDWRLIHSSPTQHPCYDPDKVRTAE